MAATWRARGYDSARRSLARRVRGGSPVSRFNRRSCPNHRHLHRRVRTNDRPNERTAARRTRPPLGGDALTQPRVVTSINGLLEYTLKVKPSRFMGPVSYNVRSYDGGTPGPTFKVANG